MKSQREIYGLAMAFTSALLTATGAVTTYDTTVTLTGCINGKVITKTAITTGVTPLLDGNSGIAPATLTANTGRIAVWAINAAGTVSVYHGPNTVMAGGVFLIPPEFPDIPDTAMPFAYQVLKAGATAGTITFGTSNWNATGFTNAIVNISTLPDRPQVS